MLDYLDAELRDWRHLLAAGVTAIGFATNHSLVEYAAHASAQYLATSSSFSLATRYCGRPYAVSFLTGTALTLGWELAQETVLYDTFLGGGSEFVDVAFGALGGTIATVTRYMEQIVAEDS